MQCEGRARASSRFAPHGWKDKGKPGKLQHTSARILAFWSHFLGLKGKFVPFSPTKTRFLPGSPIIAPWGVQWVPCTSQHPAFNLNGENHFPGMGMPFQQQEGGKTCWENTSLQDQPLNRVTPLVPISLEMYGCQEAGASPSPSALSVCLSIPPQAMGSAAPVTARAPSTGPSHQMTIDSSLQPNQCY